MKAFFEVFKFEVIGLMRSKGYRATLILMVVMLAFGLSSPRIFNMFNNDKTGVSESTSSIGIYDPTKVFDDEQVLKAAYPKGDIKVYDSSEQLNRDIDSATIDAGFAIKSISEYDYIVKDSALTDTKKMFFDTIMNSNYKSKTLQNLGVSPDEISTVLNEKVVGNSVILGKDGAMNYYYAYVLVFIIYFAVIFYGNSTATAIASEKGNRSMEILVTSTKPAALIFGKVLATCAAAIVQISVILGTAIIAYQLNITYWNHMLDFIFKIPSYVLVAFGVFGILTYIFYSFIFGALGALVSKVEDVGNSTSPITILFMLAFFGAIYTMMQPDSLLSTVITYLPFSSGMAMIAKIAMGSVALWEIALSLVVLLLSTIGVGYLGVHLYRRGTLQYGNKFSLFKMLKSMSHKKQ